MDVYLVSGGGRDWDVYLDGRLPGFWVGWGARDWDVYQDGMMIYYDLRCGATQCAKAAFGNKWCLALWEAPSEKELLKLA